MICVKCIREVLHGIDCSTPHLCIFCKAGSAEYWRNSMGMGLGHVLGMVQGEAVDSGCFQCIVSGMC